MKSSFPNPLFKKVDCVRLYVPDLEAGFVFYRDRPGHSLVWRSENAVSLRMPESEAEIVLQTETEDQEINFLVDSADEAARRIVEAGGKVIVTPFEIQIGRCEVLQDPWETPMVLLDTSKGLLEMDANGNVIGNLDP